MDRLLTPLRRGAKTLVLDQFAGVTIRAVLGNRWKDGDANRRDRLTCYGSDLPSVLGALCILEERDETGMFDIAWEQWHDDALVLVPNGSGRVYANPVLPVPA